VSRPNSEAPRAVAEPLAAIAIGRLRRDWSARARADVRQTERYTLFVVYAKRGLLIAAAVLLAVVLAYSLQPRQQNANRIALSFKNIQIVGNDLAMTSPRLTGVDEEGDPYIVTAEVAIQDRLNAKHARLKAVQGDVTLKDGAWVSLTAPAGILDASHKLLTLSGAISVFSDNGSEAHTTAANINMESGIITGNRVVTGQGPRGTFRADRFKIDRPKKLVYLYGNVHMTIFGHAKRRK
jgi:lipopolysaccharide export system protein LptC